MVDRWKVTSTSAQAGQDVTFRNLTKAYEFWVMLCGMYPKSIHTLWEDGKIIQSND